MLLPAVFVPVAEETMLISDIGERVLIMACKECASWHESGYPDMVVSVNLSIRQIQNNKIINQVNNALLQSGLRPTALDLEITESLFINNTDQMVAIFQELKRMGVIISMDDFGTGYSSLSSLKKFPIDIIKIDQSFLKDINTGSINDKLIMAIIQVAKALCLKTIAEGVETQAHMDCLTRKGCDAVQGSFIDKPMLAHDFFKKYISKIVD